MKQHISITDYSTLEYKKQIKLCDLIIRDINYSKLFQYDFVSKLNIGKLIEILKMKTNKDIVIVNNTDIWNVDLDGESNHIKKYFRNIELVDALWEAVKEIL